MRVLIVESDPTLLHNYTVYTKTELECEAIGVPDGKFIFENGEAVASCDAYVVDFNGPMNVIQILNALIPIAGKKPILVHYDPKNKPDIKRIKTIFRRKLSFRRKQHDGANMIWFLERFIP